VARSAAPTRSIPNLVATLDRELEAFAKGAPFADDRTVVIVRKLG